ncbi:type VI secretion system baseplate subunit TssE [Xenorhabdus ishibashii]|nr:GPW/gp25 family protein [Xenorhabdus ishibashii]
MNENITLLHGGYHNRNNTTRITAKDRILPSLFDRLTDHEPDKKQETINNYMLSHTALRQNILRDLQWLLNNINNEFLENLTPFPAIRHSVYNFGLSSLAGECISEIGWESIQNKIITAIHIFEPRIIPDGLEVSCISDPHTLPLYNTLSMEIKGLLWCVPWPLEFMFRSDIDLENGYFTIKEAG